MWDSHRGCVKFGIAQNRHGNNASALRVDGAWQVTKLVAIVEDHAFHTSEKISVFKIPTGCSISPVMRPQPPKTEVISTPDRKPTLRDGKMRLPLPRRRALIPGGIPNYNQPIVGVEKEKNRTTSIVAGWMILFVGFALCFVPVAGFAMTVAAIPVCAAAGVLGIVGAATGSPIGGVFLFFASLSACLVMVVFPWFAQSLVL